MIWPQFVDSPGFAAYHPTPIEITFEVKEKPFYPTADGKNPAKVPTWSNPMVHSDKWLFVYSGMVGDLNHHSNLKADEFYDESGRQGKCQCIGHVRWSSNCKFRREAGKNLIARCSRGSMVANRKGRLKTFSWSKFANRKCGLGALEVGLVVTLSGDYRDSRNIWFGNVLWHACTRCGANWRT